MSGLNKRIARARRQVLTSSTPGRVLAGVCESTGTSVPAKELSVRVQTLASLVTDTALKELPGYWNETGFDEFDKVSNRSYAYKALEQILGRALYINGSGRAPGRTRRIASEILGRQIRAGVHRRAVFNDLLQVRAGNLKYSEANGTHVEKRNLARQINKYVEKTGTTPRTFFELHRNPPGRIKPTVLLSVADSQQCQWLGLNDAGDKLLLRILLPELKGKRWSWCILSIGVNRQIIDTYESTSLCLPTLRVRKDKIYADITLDTPTPESVGNKRAVLGIDWGARRLATATVVKESNDATIVTDGRAYFFNAGPYHDKDRRRRVQGEKLWAKAQHKRALAAGLEDNNPVKEKLLKDAQDLTQEMRAVNAKRTRANRELARLLAITAVSWALAADAGAIAAEDLSSMEPVGDQKRRSILSQRLRGQVGTALSAACARAGLEFMQVNAQNTSSICPFCFDISWLVYNKVKGSSTSGYGWARCKKCNKSWDRDVVGSLNIGTRYLRDPKSGKRLKKVGHVKGAGVKDLGGVKRIRSKKPVPAPTPRYVKSRMKTGPTPKNTPGESTRVQHSQVSGATINQPATAGERVYPSGRPIPPRPGARAPIVKVVHRSAGPGTQVNKHTVVNQSGGRVLNRSKARSVWVRSLDGARYAHRHGIKCSPVRVPRAGFV